MKDSRIQYLVGAVMIAFSLYQIYVKQFWEFSLYFSAGLAFVTMGLIVRNVFPKQKRLLNVVSWVLIITAGFILLFLARTDV